MAQFGAKYIKFNPIKDQPENALPTYDKKDSVQIGRLVKADLTVNNASGELYADDVLAESLTEFASGTLAVETDDMVDDVASIVYGCEVEDKTVHYKVGDTGANIGFVISPNVNIDFKTAAFKFEFGPVQTLAHQDAGGNWVLNDPPPDYATELAKCQRYYLPGALHASLIWRYDNTSGAYFLPTPVTMRATPTITGTVKAFRTGGTKVEIPINKIDVYLYTNGIYLFVVHGTNLNSETDLALELTGGGISCDL